MIKYLEMSKVYKLDRTKFIDWLFEDIDNVEVWTREMKSDLKMGGEFVITANECLNAIQQIPKHLIENHEGDSDFVDGSDCELIYKHPFE